MRQENGSKIDISIVICVCNDQRIKFLLESINTYCEVIVVLNDSTPEVTAIVESFTMSDEFDLKIISINERNLSKARNIGTIQSKYNKVVYYDSDCIITKDAIELFSSVLDTYQLVDGKVLFRSDTIQSKIISTMRTMGVPGMALCPAMGINKSIVDKIGFFFDEDIKWIEDAELNRRASKCNIPVGRIDYITCIHDNLSFKQDLTSAIRYGSGAKIASKKNLHPKRPCANWTLIYPCMKKGFFYGAYALLWNLCYCLGYWFV